MISDIKSQLQAFINGVFPHISLTFKSIFLLKVLILVCCLPTVHWSQLICLWQGALVILHYLYLVIKAKWKIHYREDCNNVLTFLVVVATAAADFHCYDYDEGEEKNKVDIPWPIYIMQDSSCSQKVWLLLSLNCQSLSWR